MTYFGSNSMFMSKGFESHFETQNPSAESLKQNVFLKVLQLHFLYLEKGEMHKLFAILADIEDDSFLGLEVSKVLVNTVWSMVYGKIVRWIFLPYMVYFVCFIGFMTFFFNPEKYDDKIFVARTGAMGFILLLISVSYSVLQLIFEGKQMK